MIAHLRFKKVAPLQENNLVDKFGRPFNEDLHLRTKEGKPRVSKNGLLYCRPKK